MAEQIQRNLDDFVELTTVSADSRQRITLGSLSRNHQRFRIYQNSQGELLIRPMVEIPADEAWLYQNPAALAAVREGLADAAAGRIQEFDPDEF